MMQHPAHDAYTYFGAHPTGEGYTFRVWAPTPALWRWPVTSTAGRPAP